MRNPLDQISRGMVIVAHAARVRYAVQNRFFRPSLIERFEQLTLECDDASSHSKVNQSWVIKRGQLRSKRIKHSERRAVRKAKEANKARRVRSKRGRFMGVEAERAADQASKSSAKH
jgi:hypothetical protein